MLTCAYSIWIKYWCTSSIIITLKLNMATNQVHYLLTQIVWCMKLKQNRGGSRTAATSKMELFVIIVNGFQSLTIITKCSILDVAAVLDLPLEDVYEDLSKDKEMFDFNNYFAESKYYNDSHKLFVGKMKYETVVLLLKNLLY